MGDGQDMIVIDNATADMFGLRSALDGGVLFCGVSEEHFAINGVTYRWPPGSKLSWSLGFSRLGDLDDLTLKQTYTACFAEISACCDIAHEYVANPRAANIVVNVARLDGRGGVLADMQIPVGNVSDSTTQLLGRVDDGEVWGLFENPPADKIDFYRVALHELLHSHGLGHKPVNVAEPALIAPMYSRTIRHLQEADKAELVRRYGVAKGAPIPPAAPSVPPGVKPNVEVAVTIDGEKWIAAGTLKRA